MGSLRATEKIEQVAAGRTELVFDLPANSLDREGVSLLRHCAYYGDVSAVRHLLGRGESLSGLGPNFDLNGAAFHGHWRLCQFLLEEGAAVNQADTATGETALHAALCTADRLVYDRVLQVLFAHGADPNVRTVSGAETGGFMRDCRTKGETPLHRAAAFGTEDTIRMLLKAGAAVDVKDGNGDSPLTWGSWYLRPAAVLRLLCFGEFRIRAGNRSMRENLLGFPTLY